MVHFVFSPFLCAGVYHRYNRTQQEEKYISPLKGIEFDAAVYLARHVWDAINETVIAAKDGWIIFKYVQGNCTQTSIIWHT